MEKSETDLYEQQSGERKRAMERFLAGLSRENMLPKARSLTPDEIDELFGF